MQNRMLEQRVNRGLSVSPRSAPMITRPPNYLVRQEVMQEVAAERELNLFHFHRIIWTFLNFLEVFLAFRFVLRLIAANPNSGFAVLMYGVTGIFTAPFNALIQSPVINGAGIIEITTLIAMAVYALLFWAIEYVIRMAADLAYEREFMNSIVRTPRQGPVVNESHTWR